MTGRPPLGMFHDKVEDASRDNADDQEKRGAGVVVDDHDEDDDAEQENQDGQDERHFDRTLAIRLAPTKIQKSGQSNALLKGQDLKSKYTRRFLRN